MSDGTSGRPATASVPVTPNGPALGQSLISRVVTGGVWQGALALALTLAIVVVLLYVLRILARPLVLTLAAVILAQALAPAAARLQRWVPRAVAVLALYLVLVAVVGLIGWLIVPSLVRQGQDLAANAPDLVEQGRGLVDSWDPTSDGRVLQELQSALGRFSSVLVSVPFTVVSAAFSILFVLAVSIYWLLAQPALTRFVLSFFPAEHRRQAREVLHEMGQTMGGYVRGTVIDSAIIGTLTYAGLLVIGVDYPAVLGVIGGLGELVPIIGPIISGVPALLVALLDSPQQALMVLIFLVVLQQVESNIVLPHVMARQADIPPMLVLLALFAGEEVGGIIGALTAIPLAGAVRVFVMRVTVPVIRQRLTGKMEGSQPQDDEGE